MDYLFVLWTLKMATGGRKRAPVVRRCGQLAWRWHYSELICNVRRADLLAGPAGGATGGRLELLERALGAWIEDLGSGRIEGRESRAEDRGSRIEDRGED